MENKGEARDVGEIPYNSSSDRTAFCSHCFERRALKVARAVRFPPTDLLASHTSLADTFRMLFDDRYCVRGFISNGTCLSEFLSEAPFFCQANRYHARARPHNWRNPSSLRNG